MKKLKLNCPLHHKAYSHDTVQVEVEKVITLYGSRFQQMRDHPLEDCPEIAQHRDLMYMRPVKCTQYTSVLSGAW